MKQGIQINCDVGEGVENEAELMPYIQQCNIACGGHAGDVESMGKIVQLAINNNVAIGAHPSYPDRVNFGRKSIEISSQDLVSSIQSQIESLMAIVNANSASMTHIKAHGALYNDIVKNEVLAVTFLRAIVPYKTEVKLFVPFNSIISKLAKKQGFSTEFEAFADRNYNDDLSLVSRNNKNAILTDIPDIVKHIKGMKVSGTVITVNQHEIKIKATTFCVHSDTSNAIEIVKELNKLNIS